MIFLCGIMIFLLMYMSLGNRIFPVIGITLFPYHFFGANQRKVDVKIFSWTQCAINKDWRDWHILGGNDERIARQNLNRNIFDKNT